MGVLTRYITTSPIVGNSGDLRDGASYTFSVNVDTGAANYPPKAARLYISRMASYVSTYYIDIDFGGDTVARTPNLSAFSEREVLLYLENLQPGLLTESPWYITLTNVASGGTGRKNNYRDGCYLELEIDYEVPDPVYNAVRYYNGQDWLPCNVRYYNGQDWLPCNVLYSADGNNFE